MLRTVEGEDGGAEGNGGEPLVSVPVLEGLLPISRRELEDPTPRPGGQQAEQVAEVGHGSMRCRPQLAERDTKVVFSSAASSEPTQSEFRRPIDLAAQLQLARVVVERQPPVV